MSVPNLEKIYFGDKIISDVYGLDRTLYTATQIIPIPPSVYFTDFEDGTKTAYGTATVTLSGVQWSITEAVIGTLVGDLKNGLRSLRVRSNDNAGTPFNATMTQNLTGGLASVTFLYGRYSTDTSQPNTYVEYSTNDGSSWTQIGSTIAAGNYPTTLTSWSATGLNISGNVRLRIRSDLASNQTRRFNIDNITITGI